MNMYFLLSNIYVHFWMNKDSVERQNNWTNFSSYFSMCARLKIFNCEYGGIILLGT